jgi:hypothetical protein
MSEYRNCYLIGALRLASRYFTAQKLMPQVSFCTWYFAMGYFFLHVV